jgi:hypothetical protein
MKDAKYYSVDMLLRGIKYSIMQAMISVLQDGR